MSPRASKIALIIYAILFILSGFLPSVARGNWAWYAIMVPFAIVPLLLGRGWYRLAGGVALVLAGSLISSEIDAGKRFRERLERRQSRHKEAATLNGEQNGCRQRLGWHLSCHRRFPLAVA